MAKQQSSAVYWRRRLLLLIVILIPLFIVGKALTRHESTPTATPTASSKPTPKKSTATRTASASPTSTPSATPTIGDCRDKAITVTVATDAEQYTVGSPVTISMRIRNTGTVDCNRDIGALPNEVYVADAQGAVVWTSDACQTDAKPQVVLMKAGSVYGNTQVWNGANSGRDCTSAAADAAAGTYYAYARNDSVQSKGVAFTIG